jgi:N utilization substance protein A
VRLVDPEGQHAHVLVPPDQLSLAIGREGQNVRLAARLTGWKIDIKNAADYDQVSEDARAAELIALREEDERQQAEAEARLAVEQAARAEEDARLRELYPLPEDEEAYDSYAEAGETEADDEAEPAAESEDVTSVEVDAATEVETESATELQ